MSRERDWRDYWNAVPQVRNSNPLKQVGKTIGGIPVGARLVNLTVRSIRSALRLRMQDVVLELCCGNGLITFKVAKHCARIMAIDFSAPLIATARQRFQRENICYTIGDVTALGGPAVNRRFDKVFMHEALQHLTSRQTDDLLSCLAASASRNARIFLASIPDAECLRNFYNTPERYRQYCESIERGLEPIGTWWRQGDIIALAEKHAYRTTVLKQNPELHTSHYRFDIILDPRKER
jgi:cyclopropane fatty-acyl-phospholipid synthase-like methyltransferase